MIPFPRTRRATMGNKRANQVSILVRFNHSTNEHLKGNYCIGARKLVDDETPLWVPVDYVYLRMKGESS
jgi:hypothetical protein